MLLLLLVWLALLSALGRSCAVVLLLSLVLVFLVRLSAARVLLAASSWLPASLLLCSVPPAACWRLRLPWRRLRPSALRGPLGRGVPPRRPPVRGFEALLDLLGLLIR